MNNKKNTESKEYTNYLSAELSFIKKIIDVQLPYRLNLIRLKMGVTLDVGCGTGRNLVNLVEGSLGVDHNKYSIEIAKKNGNQAVTVSEFKKVKNKYINHFDSMLVAHVLEHVSIDQAKEIINYYIPCVKNKIVIICPQEKGFKKDITHVNFLNEKDINNILLDCGLKIIKNYSFPLPKFFGKIFTYNETVVVAKK